MVSIEIYDLPNQVMGAGDCLYDCKSRICFIISFASLLVGRLLTDLNRLACHRRVSGNVDVQLRSIFDFGLF